MITMSSFFEVVPWSRQCHILSVCSERKLKDINQMPNLYLAVWRLSGRKEMPPSWHLIKKDWKNSDLLSMIYQNLLIFCGFHLYSNFSCAVIAVVCIQVIKAKWKMCTQEKLFGGGGKVGGGGFLFNLCNWKPTSSVRVSLPVQLLIPFRSLINLTLLTELHFNHVCF